MKKLFFQNFILCIFIFSTSVVTAGTVDRFKYGFKNTTGQAATDFHLEIPDGKFVSVGPNVNDNIAADGKSVDVNGGLNVPNNQRLTLDVKLQGYSGSKLTGYWTDAGGKIAGSEFTFIDIKTTTVALGGGNFGIDLVIGNTTANETLSLTGLGYSFVDNFFDVFVDLPITIDPIADFSLNPGESALFSNLGVGIISDQFYLTGNMLSSIGTDIDFQLTSKIPEPASLWLGLTGIFSMLMLKGSKGKQI